MQTPPERIADEAAVRSAVERTLPVIERAISDRLRAVAEARATSAIRGPFLPDA